MPSRARLNLSVVGGCVGSLVAVAAACTSFEQAPPTFCATRTGDLVCADFEPPNDKVAPQPFLMRVSEGLPAELVDDVTSRGSKALLIRVDATKKPVGDTQGPLLTTTRKASPLRCAFALKRRGALPAGTGIIVGALRGTWRAGAATLSATFSGDSVFATVASQFPDGGQSSDEKTGKVTFVLQEDTWVRFVLEANEDKAAVYVEADPTNRNEFTWNARQFDTVEVLLGNLAAPPNTVGTILLDDIACAPY